MFLSFSVYEKFYLSLIPETVVQWTWIWFSVYSSFMRFTDSLRYKMHMEIHFIKFRKLWARTKYLFDLSLPLSFSSSSLLACLQSESILTPRSLLLTCVIMSMYSAIINKLSHLFFLSIRKIWTSISRLENVEVLLKLTMWFVKMRWIMPLVIK